MNSFIVPIFLYYFIALFIALFFLTTKLSRNDSYESYGCTSYTDCGAFETNDYSVLEAKTPDLIQEEGPEYTYKTNEIYEEYTVSEAKQV